MQKHAAKFNAYQGMLRKDKIVKQKNGCHLNKIFFKRLKTQMYSVIKASYVTVNLTEKKKKSKPFSDGEFVKQCTENTTDILCPD